MKIQALDSPLFMPWSIFACYLNNPVRISIFIIYYVDNITNNNNDIIIKIILVTQIFRNHRSTGLNRV